MKQYLTRRLHLAGGEGLGSRVGLEANWNHGHPLRRAWCCKVNKQAAQKCSSSKQASPKQISPKQISREKIRRS